MDKDMLTETLCRHVMDAAESTEELPTNIRKFLKDVAEKHKSVTKRKERALLEKWSKKLLSIIITVRLFPTEYQLAIESSIYAKILARIMAMYLDVNILIARKSLSPDEHYSQIFRDLFLMQDKLLTANIWSVIANSSLVDMKNSKHLEGLVSLALSRFTSSNVVHTNEQYLRMGWVLNRFLPMHPEIFDRAAEDAMKVKVYKGLDKYLNHCFGHFGFKNLTIDQAKEKLFDRNKQRPKDQFFNELGKQIEKEDVTNIEQKFSFQEQLAKTEIWKAGAEGSKLVKIASRDAVIVNGQDEEAKQDKSSKKLLDPAPSAVASKAKQPVGRAKNLPAKVNGTENEGGDTAKTPTRKTTNSMTASAKRRLNGSAVLNEEDTEIEQDRQEIIVEKISSERGWQILWKDSIRTGMPEIKLDKLNLANYKKVSEGSYLLTPNKKQRT